MRVLPLLLCAAYAAASAADAAPGPGVGPHESFAEDLLVKPLPDGRVLLHFEFAFRRNHTQHHYHLFPRQLGEIALRYGVDELHLAFTQGNWREARWGHPPSASQGVGADVRARIAGTGEHASRQWRGLTNALSGVFCASLNFIDESNTALPQMAFAEHAHSRAPALRQGYLPRENVCTENLTPWIKQLPCQSRSGLAALLNPYRLYNMHFHSMGMSLEAGASHAGERSEQAALRYTQYLSVVLDPRTMGLGSRWSLSELVGMPLAPACPVADKSTVRILAPPEIDLGVEPLPAEQSKHLGMDMYTFDLKLPDTAASDIELVFAAPQHSESAAGATQLPAVAVHRHVTGHGGSSGGVEATIVNRDSRDINITYFDSLPWYLRVYSHTLEIHTYAAGSDDDTVRSGQATRLHPTKMVYVPAIDRGRPSAMEVALTLPRHSHTVLRYSFDKGFLKYTEHPPDANRGFNIRPAIVSYAVDSTLDPGPLYCTSTSGRSSSGACIARVYSELFLANLATPDFSMPYNVITFTCTILALFFGRIFNLLTRDFAILDVEAEGSKRTKTE
ncbi:Subunit of the glycosylphosphatidylinositol transamidase complex-like protein [Coemansia erecta]|uniref:Subunit of the glycosylphosphatidylinositol transamidase complex-like protein n=1 Tax=Coemansia erecta TaxID=147472 RepID=A0A9W7Y7H4_9FUNG|nr:Subunit of the glycosylphosphatidylinositol transamidase complex-like protein [Coemansia erecta]